MTRCSLPRTIRSAAILLALAGLLSGCSAPLFAGMSLGEFGFVTSLFSTAATGKGLGEHAMDAATGRDCRIVEGLAREDRKLCERKTSPALEKDWKGLASLADGNAPAPDTNRLRAEPRDGRDG